MSLTADSSAQMFSTPLTAWHKAHGAKMAPFAGWDMPIQYSGILDEHKQTRERAAIFDICHMGEFTLSGPGAAEALSKIVTHNLATLKPGRCRYGFMLNEQGGVLDDLIVYRKGADDFFLVVNAARAQDDFQWLRAHLPDSLAASALQDVSEHTGKIDLQGPESLVALEACLGVGETCGEACSGASFRALPYFGFMDTTFSGAPLMVSRTGYTGELGYELYLPASKTLELWEALLKQPQVKPAGLGARDTLRLEAGLCLYGQDLDTEHTPAEAGYTAMLTSEADYVGKEGALKVRERLLALSIEGRRSARHHDLVFSLNSGDGEPVGRVTSASFAPSLGHSVALAYVKAEYADQPAFSIETQRAQLTAKVVSLPFYQGNARVKL